MNGEVSGRPKREEKFHDEWAVRTDIISIDVVKSNESITAPELRYITQQLGLLRGKKLIDVGCGLGEASVYFAIKGADVTSIDISESMLQAVKELAARNHVSIKTYKSNIEELFFGEKFDIVYAGNLFHHVNVESALKEFTLLLKEDGVLVSWDPLAYNPFINLYRFIARKVRTLDEHPLTMRDISLFRKYFPHVKVRYFWLSSLLIFIYMVIFQLRNPNKERFWKVVVDEGDKWAWLYKPLEAFDTFILKLFPFLGFLCWNVVIVARKNRSHNYVY